MSEDASKTLTRTVIYDLVFLPLDTVDIFHFFVITFEEFFQVLVQQGFIVGVGE